MLHRLRCLSGFPPRRAEHPVCFATPPKNPEQFGHEAILEYLQSLDSVDHALIVLCSQWLLKNHPQAFLTLWDAMQAADVVGNHGVQYA
ncbi:hypothetical protein KC19_1G268300 [Ceratodon purpureus]|uniref:Uncharacterized protein n=1 Tax=Ceratodon purpureus TaxID=3225 RepID=A0A8T0JA52_CERPU|nr:hypothetical protein KC19_1G268300 [Ceratodon purpureus]